MLSTQYRLKLEAICDKIIKGHNVELDEIIWCEKLANANRSAETILRQARRKAQNPTMVEGDIDDFLNKLDIGGIGNESKGLSGFSDVDEIVDFFKKDNKDDWRQRD
tara:strand:- start:148 stop:468 length:321 start_codon:yes stop_codon:yes gene_type:complete